MSLFSKISENIDKIERKSSITVEEANGDVCVDPQNKKGGRRQDQSL